jgi:hypothetical protein
MSSYVVFDGQTWPHPSDPGEISWMMTYVGPVSHCTKSERLIASSYVRAYRRLIDMPQRERNKVIEQIKRAAT